MKGQRLSARLKMKIITISRQFGSGGREVGKRLADELGFAYYDKQIITAVAEKSSLDAGYIETIREQRPMPSFSLTFGRTFSYPDIAEQNYTKILLAEQQVIEEIAKKGESFIIVGRSADVILSEYKPFNIFVYADMESKVKRCRQRQDKNENLTDRELIRKIKRIDSGRVISRRLISDAGWGEKENYNLCLNTTGASIKKLIPGLAVLAENWFE